MSVTLTWTGHATWLVDTGHGMLLVDPFLDDCPTASMKARDVGCDAILLTHGHFDHVADVVPIAKRTGAPVFCNFKIAQWLGRQGVEQATSMNIGGRTAVPGGTATMEIAWHSSSLPDGSYGGTAAQGTLCFMRAALCRGLLVQGPRRLSLLQRPPDGTDSCAPRRPRHTPGACPAMGGFGAKAAQRIPG